jgi:hypothetical protein
MAKVLLISVIGALVLSALFGIGAFLFGNFGETSMRILATTLSVSFYSLMALACAAALEKRRAKVTALPGLAVCGIGFVCLLLVIWVDGEFAEASAILALFAFSFAQTCMLSFVRLKRQWVWVSWTAHVAIFWLAALLSTMIVLDLDDEWFFRIAGVLGIIDGCASLSIPLIYKLGGGIAPDVTRRLGSHIELTCPACGLRGSYPIGSIQCPQCALKIRVEVAGMKAPADDPPFQFSIKSLLLVMFIVAAGLGLLTYRMEHVRAVRAERDLHIILNEAGMSVWRDGSVMVSNAKPVREQELMLLEQLPYFEEMVFNNASFTDSGFAHLKKLNLKHITFASMQITEAGWARVGEMTTLESLTINETLISAEDIARLKNCNVHTLRLFGTGLTDAGLLHIKRWPKLTELHLNELKITKDGLAQLKDAPMLKTLGLAAGTDDMSKEDVDELRRTLPRIDIHANRPWEPSPTIP